MADEYQVFILSRANRDVDHIYTWLLKRSPAGAGKWYSAFLQAASSLSQDPERCAMSLESERLGAPIRNHFFKTPSGRIYRIVFLVVGNEVRILRVRGPGQPPLKSIDQLE